jgi:hypothetical protein
MRAGEDTGNKEIIMSNLEENERVEGPVPTDSPSTTAEDGRGTSYQTGRYT